MICVYFTHPFASASANRWVCLCCLSDGAHHQLDQRTLLPVRQHYREKQKTFEQRRDKDTGNKRETEWQQRSETEKRIKGAKFQGTRFYYIISSLWFSAVVFYLIQLLPKEIRSVWNTVCLTLFSLHGLLQQQFSHTLPVFQQLLRAFPQRVDKVSCMLVELHTKSHWKRLQSAGIILELLCVCECPTSKTHSMLIRCVFSWALPHSPKRTALAYGWDSHWDCSSLCV